LNLYAYVCNHPTDTVDADGHQPATTAAPPAGQQPAPSASATNATPTTSTAALPVNPTPGQRQPDGSYIAPLGPGTEADRLANPSTTERIGNGECVTLTSYLTSVPPQTWRWKMGPPLVISVNGVLTINPAVKPGTAVATFNNVSGTYPTDNDQNSGTFRGAGNRGPGSVLIEDQWPKHPPDPSTGYPGTEGRPPQSWNFRYDDGSTKANSAYSYHVILVNPPK